MTRRRRERRDADEDEAVVGCLDVLRGASALMAQHKAGLARLLARRDERERGALERLVSDLTEVLSTASTSSGGGSSQPQAVEREQREEQEEGGVSDSEAAARRGGGGGGAMAGGGVKRAKAQQAAQAGMGQQQGLSSSSAAVAACEGRDALAIPEVLEHVMSFAEDKELLGRLSRVCRLWRVVSEGERLSLRVVERRMPSALVGGVWSLRASLGGSARRCLLAHNASMTAGRLMCSEDRLHKVRELRLMIEIFHRDTALCAMSGGLSSYPDWGGDDGAEYLALSPYYNGRYEAKAFSASSLRVPATGSIHRAFEWGMLDARIFVMDVTTGVTASLFEGPLTHEGEPPEPEGRWASLIYITKPVPVTSMTYAGPPLQAQVRFSIRACEEPGQDDMAGLATQRERLWKFEDHLQLWFTGQPSIYGERFIRTRLAEEAKAAKQHGSR